MLARCAMTLGRGLQRNLALPDSALVWFEHHATADAQHAEEALYAIAEYVRGYAFDTGEVRAIVEITFVRNVFVRRYLESDVTHDTTTPAAETDAA